MTKKEEILNAYIDSFVKEYKSDSSSTICQDDLDFALELHKKYKNIPFDELCLFIKNIRRRMIFNKRVFEDRRKTWKRAFGLMVGDKLGILLGDDIKVEKICITTNNGEIDLIPGNYIYNSWFLPALQELEKSCEISFNILNKQEHKHLIDIPAKKICQFGLKLPLGVFQKRVAIGFLMVHFQVYMNDSPLMTEAEWKENESSAFTYRHYLSDKVKTWIRNL